MTWRSPTMEAECSRTGVSHHCWLSPFQTITKSITMNDVTNMLVTFIVTYRGLVVRALGIELFLI